MPDDQFPPCPFCGAPCQSDTNWGGWIEWGCSGKQHNGVGCFSTPSRDVWMALAELALKAATLEHVKSRLDALDDEAYDSVAIWAALDWITESLGE